MVHGGMDGLADAGVHVPAIDLTTTSPVNDVRTGEIPTASPADMLSERGLPCLPAAMATRCGTIRVRARRVETPIAVAFATVWPP